MSQSRLTLPENPNLEQLREQAKERLDVIRATAPDAHSRMRNSPSPVIMDFPAGAHSKQKWTG